MTKRAAKAVKTPSKTPTRPGKHGGRLRTGGTNRGGPGRPPSAVREACALSFADRMEVLEAIADGKPVQVIKLPNGEETQATVSASPADRIKAMDLLGKYGGLQKLELGGTLGIDGLLNDLADQPDDPE